jgi:hypothetical protein
VAIIRFPKPHPQLKRDDPTVITGTITPGNNGYDTGYDTGYGANKTKVRFRKQR